MALFEDGKDAGALRTIGEVAAALGVRTHVLRYWEEQFSQLKPLKRAGGRRLYRPDDVALIERIDRLINHEGYTLKGARAALGNTKPALDRTQDVQINVEIDSRGGANVSTDLLLRLKAIRADLAAALAA